MFQKMIYGVTWFVLIAALVTVGCSSSESGSSLQKAIQEAQGIYEQAMAKFKDAFSSVVTVCPPTENKDDQDENVRVIDYRAVMAQLNEASDCQAVMPQLSQAAEILNKALRTIPEDDKMVSGDVVTAQLLLLQIESLRGRIVAVQAQSDMRDLNIALNDAFGVLGEIKSNKTDLAVLGASVQINVEDIDKKITDEKKIMAAASKDVDAIKGQMGKLDNEKTTLKKKIVADTLEESELRAKTLQTSGNKSLQLTEKALAVRDRIHNAEVRTQQIDSELIQVKAKLDRMEVLLAKAKKAIDQLDAQKGEAIKAKNVFTTELQEKKAKLAQSVKKLKEALDKAAGTLAPFEKTQALASKAFDAASRAGGVAIKHCRSDEKTQVLRDKAAVSLDAGQFQLILVDSRQAIQGVVSHIQGVWSDMPSDSPAIPDMASLTAYVAKGAIWPATAEESYKEAIASLEKAADMARGDARAEVGLSLRKAQQAYARALEAIGKNDEAGALLDASKPAPAPSPAEKTEEAGDASPASAPTD